MKTYKIHLIRHGMTQANLDGKYIGQSDLPLAPQGIEELNELKEASPYPQVRAFFSGPLSRCTQTLKIFYPEADPIIIPGLTEYNFGLFEGKSPKELEHDEDYIRWVSDNQDAAPPEGESNSRFMGRVTETFSKIVEGLLKSGITESVICTHGGVMMAICSAFGLPEAPMHEWASDHGCGYTLRITPSLWMRDQKLEVADTLPFSLFVEDVQAENDDAEWE